MEEVIAEVATIFISFVVIASLMFMAMGFALVLAQSIEKIFEE